MPTYTPHEQSGDRIEASYRKTLDAVSDMLTAGLAYLKSASTENRQLIAEGENLTHQSVRAPDGEPPHNLVQAVLKWIKGVVQWGTRHLENLRRSALERRNNPALERRVNELERRVDALETAVMDLQESLASFRREVNERFDAVDQRFDAVDQRFDAVDQRFDAVDQRFEAVDQRFDAIDQRFEAVDQQFADIYARFDDIKEEFKRTRRDLHRHVNRLANRFNDLEKQMGQRFDILEDATMHERATVIEDALVKWTRSQRAWHEILPSVLQSAWIETLELWSDRAPAFLWPSLCQRLGVPETLSIQSCDVLTQVEIKGPGAPAPFFVVGEASVKMDGERIRKTLQHVQELGQHTEYPVIPCVCARVYTSTVLDQTRAAGVIALQWQRGDIAHPISIPDAVKDFLGF